MAISVDYQKECLLCFFGCPNLTVTPRKKFMGLRTKNSPDMRVINIYRREDDKLAENWYL